MIKINLLPVKAAKRRADGQKQLLIGAVAVIVTLIGIILFYGSVVTRVNVSRPRSQTQISLSPSSI